MIVLNFTHPLTPDQVTQVEGLIHQKIERLIPLPVQFDHQSAYLPQLEKALQGLPLTPQELQSAPILVNLPSFNAIAALVLAELHGRMGYFPPVIRLRPVEGAIPPRYEAAEILNLQSVRDAARTRR